MADDSFNYSYTPTVEHREPNLFREEYYSGTDTKIYFDDEEQNEIGYIQYELQEQLKPIYGYNSRTFDDIVIGNRIVTGTFSVPIKNTAKQRFNNIENTNNIKTKENKTEKYNENQNKKLQDTDWFGSTAKTIRSNAGPEIDDKTVVKLLALGYNIDVDHLDQNSYRKAISNFQKDKKIGVTGELNSTTTNKINEEFKKINADTIDLDNKNGYSRMTLNDRAKKLSGDGLILETVRTDKHTLYYVLSNDGKRYYVIK